MVRLFAAPTDTLKIFRQKKRQPDTHHKRPDEFERCIIFSSIPIFNQQLLDPNLEAVSFSDSRSQHVKKKSRGNLVGKIKVSLPEGKYQNFC